MSRKTAREVSMKLAFARLFGGEDTYEAVLDKSDIHETPTDDDIAYASAALEGVSEHGAEIDALISELAISWRVERMPRVDLSILRIAVWEILYRRDIPNSVSINEAVELAKAFGGDHSSAFINGILGSLTKKLETTT